MNTEEIKAVLSAISSLAEGGKEAFIWYLVVDLSKYALQALAWVSSVSVVGFVVWKAILTLNPPIDQRSKLDKLFDAAYQLWLYAPETIGSKAEAYELKCKLEEAVMRQRRG